MRVTDESIDHTMNGFGSSPDGLGLSVGLADDDFEEETPPLTRALYIGYALAGVAGTAIGAYHGYKRNDSVGWAIVWAALGGIFPIVVIPVALAQGIGDRHR